MKEDAIYIYSIFNPLGVKFTMNREGFEKCRISNKEYNKETGTALFLTSTPQFYQIEYNFLLNGICQQRYNQRYKNSLIIKNPDTKVPVVSVVMLVYNSDEYILDSIESVLNQTFEDFELIIIDDGSTDDTLKIIESISDEHIKLVKNNHDYIQSLNKGIAKSRGKYIVRMDSDDIMLSNRLETQVEYMENNPQIDICGGWMKSIGQSSVVMKTPIKHKEIILAMLMENCIAHPTTMMRKESMSNLPFYPNLYKQKYTYAEDYKLWIDSIMNGLQLANIPNVLHKYRVSEKQSTSKILGKIWNVSTRVQIEYLEYVMGEISKQNEKLYIFLDNTIDLFNKGKLKIHNLKEIIYSIYSSQLN